MNDPVLWLLLPAMAVYALYHSGASQAAWRARMEGCGIEEEEIAVRCVLLQRVWGALLLGAGTVGLLLLHDLGWTAGGLGAPSLADSLGWTGLLALALAPILFFASRLERQQRHYPEIRLEFVAPKVVLVSAATWLLYLLAYEAFFRGVLLFALAAELGDRPAVAIVTALYAAVHLTKNAGEMVGTLVMGVAFAHLALLAGGFWPAFFLHAFVAVLSENLSGRAHPRVGWGRPLSGAAETPERAGR